MQLAIHLGAHCTDDDRLLRSLLQNKGRLAEQGIAVPGPGRYRETIVKAAQKLKGAEAEPQAQKDLIDDMIDDDSTHRIVLSFEDFICVSGRVFEKGMLYEKAGYKPMWLRNLFSDHQVEFFLSVRNPATFIPAVAQHPRQTHKSIPALLQGTDTSDICWSDVAVGIKDCAPDAPLTVWANEDTPYIWPEVMREVSGHDDSISLKGGLNIAGQIMHREGLRRMKAYMASHPPRTEHHRRRVVTAFLDKYAIDEEVEEELDVPGWTDQIVEAITDNCYEDLDEIAKIGGVTFLSP